MYITTIVYIIDIDGFFDLDIIFKYIKINDIILGVKYKKNIKGNIKNTICFLNQLTINTFFENKNINIKLFLNGTIQITGTKCTDQLYRLLDYILDNLSNIHGNITITPDIIDDSYNLYNNKLIIDNKYRPEILYINNEKLFNFNGLKLEKKYLNGYPILTSYKHILFKKRVFNCNFQEIGYMQYTFKQKYKNLRLVNTELRQVSEFEFEIYRYNNLIGKINYILHGKLTSPIIYRHSISIEYYGVIGNTSLGDLNIKNMNGTGNILIPTPTNMYYIDLITLYTVLCKYEPDLLVIYDNSKYAGLSITLRMFDKKIKISIFSTGKILVFNMNEKSQLEKIILYINTIFNKYNSNETTYKLIKNKEIKVLDYKLKQLTIFDVI